MKYRADIDGLRAVAVVPVVLFHAGLPLMGGGFVGVDVFFVISGFLITSIIASEIEGGHFSIASFYDRRIRRIFPALAVVMFFCVIVGFFVMTPTDFKSLGGSVVATTLFLSNMYFWRETGYFTTAANEQPLLHTWSLSIEEQFYLFFPLLLIALFKYARPHCLTILKILMFCSFVSGALLLQLKPSAAFFLGPVRAWELISGCLVALGVVSASKNFTVKLASAIIGIAMIVVPMVLYDAQTQFPGFAALPPTLGTCLLIWSGLGTPTLVHLLLSTRALVEVGKASYSLYLWHFPVLAFSQYVALGELTPLTIGITCLVSVALAFGSLHFIERPFRFMPPPKYLQRPVLLAIFGMVAVGSLGATISFQNGFAGRMDEVSRKYLAAESDRMRHHMNCLSVDQIVIRPTDACKIGANDTTPSVLLWGDSHAAVTATALEKAALRHNASFLFTASVDCPVALGVAIEPNTKHSFVNSPAYQYCEQYNQEMLHLANSNKNIKTVVLSSRWTNWRIGEPGSLAETKVDIRLRDQTGVSASAEANKEIFARGFLRLIAALEQSGKKVWVVGPLPLPMVSVPRAAYIRHLGFDKRSIDISNDDFRKRNAWILSLFAQASKIHSLNFIWPDTALCHGDVCPVTHGGLALFFDHNHLSVEAARQTSFLYDQIFSQHNLAPDDG